MSTYLITGIAGFIGSRIAEALVAAGAEVRGLDNLSTGKYENIEHLTGNIEFHCGDIRDASTVAELCRGADYVIHLASLGTQLNIPDEVIPVTQTNIDGTLNVLIAARNAGVRRVVLASSCAVYGTDVPGTKSETMVPNPATIYAVTKYAAENYARAFYETYRLETVSLRYFHVYGPGQSSTSRYACVLNRLLCEIINGETATIFGDGESIRDLIYVSDVVNATILSCTLPAFRVAGKVINIGSGRGFPVYEVFEQVRSVLGYRGVLVYGPERRSRLRSLIADVTLARQALGFVPQEPLSEGIRACAAFIRNSSVPASPGVAVH